MGVRWSGGNNQPPPRREEKDMALGLLLMGGDLMQQRRRKCLKTNTVVASGKCFHWSKERKRLYSAFVATENSVERERQRQSTCIQPRYLYCLLSLDFLGHHSKRIHRDTRVGGDGAGTNGWVGRGGETRVGKGEGVCFVVLKAGGTRVWAPRHTQGNKENARAGAGEVGSIGATRAAWRGEGRAMPCNARPAQLWSRGASCAQFVWSCKLVCWMSQAVWLLPYMSNSCEQQQQLQQHFFCCCSTRPIEALRAVCRGRSRGPRQWWWCAAIAFFSQPRWCAPSSLLLLWCGFGQQSCVLGLPLYPIHCLSSTTTCVGKAHHTQSFSSALSVLLPSFLPVCMFFSTGTTPWMPWTLTPHFTTSYQQWWLSGA